MFRNIPLAVILQWCCFVSSLVLLRNAKPEFWRTFRFYLLAIVLVETTCNVLAMLSRNNVWLYNLIIPVMYGFQIWVFSRLIRLPRLNIFYWFAYLSFAAFYVRDLAVQQTLFQIVGNAHSYGTILMIALSILYYYSLFQQEEYIDLYQEAAFWFVTGLFIFNTMSLGMNIFFRQMVKLNVASSIRFAEIIIDILNLILYGSWIRAFICLRAKQKLN
jgi:hypothetical protein